MREVGFCEHTTRSAYMQRTALHLPLTMTPKPQDLLTGNCPQRALALMREAIPSDPLVSKMTARWTTNWSQRRRPLPPSKAALEKWINDLAPETRRMTGMTHIASCTPSRRMGYALLRALLLQTSSVMHGEVDERITYPLMGNYR